MQHRAERVVDAKGLACPLPILKARRAMDGLQPGDTLEVLATDPGSMADFEAFCRSTGHELLAAESDAGVFRFQLRKTA
jgi:tRNA 2-thiouridine synthesizing protein A